MAEIKNQRPRRKFGLGDLFVLILLVIVVAGIIIGATQTNNKVENLSYIELTTKMEEGLIVNIQAQGVKGDGNDKIVYVVGKFVDTYENAKSYTSTITWNQYDGIVLSIQNAADTSPLSSIEILPIKAVNTVSFWSVASLLLPILIVVVGLVFLFKTAGSNSNKQAFDFGKSRARLAKKSGVTFKDVAGLAEEKEEMVELVDFLKKS